MLGTQPNHQALRFQGQYAEDQKHGFGTFTWQERCRARAENSGQALALRDRLDGQSNGETLQIEICLKLVKWKWKTQLTFVGERCNCKISSLHVGHFSASFSHLVFARD